MPTADALGKDPYAGTSTSAIAANRARTSADRDALPNPAI
jgi:hypothetical protein